MVNATWMNPCPKVYVACSWKDRKHAKRVMEFLKEKGLHVTLDWTVHEDETKTLQYCKEDFNGVYECETLVFLHSGNESAGKYIEFGMAAGLGKRIISVGEELTTVFKHLIDKHVQGDITTNKIDQEIYNTISNDYD